MRLRYAGACRMCGTELQAKTEAVYERAAKTSHCVSCPDVPTVASHEPPGVRPEPAREVDPGVPGASARREFERRHARREDRVRSEHRRLGGLILALSDNPQSTKAWDTGALGEERLGARLNELVGDSLRVLHDRKVPGSSANIDHLAVTPHGVFVIDAKRYQGRPPTARPISLRLRKPVTRASPRARHTLNGRAWRCRRPDPRRIGRRRPRMSAFRNESAKSD